MRLEKICKRLLVKDPFWGFFLLGLNKGFSTKTDTIAVARSGVGTELLVNQSFWEGLSDTERMAVLLHELHHLCFNHFLMGQDFPDKDRFNMAADMEVNCYVDGLPDGCVRARMFGFPKWQGAKYYYRHLPESMGGMSGNGHDDGDGERQGKEQMPSSCDDHSTWKEFQDMPAAQRELARNRVESLVRNAATQTMKQKGKIPSHLKDMIDDLLKERPRVHDWKAELRRMLASTIDVSLKRTRQRESKRFADSPGLKFRRKVRILVAIDTSGSVSDTELSEFFGEITHVYRAGASIHVIECDAAVHSDWEFRGSGNVEITGGGGTDFAPAVNWYRDHGKEYTKFMFFTDGCASTDNLNVPNDDMIWVISSKGDHGNKYPGKVIYIPGTETNQ